MYTASVSCKLLRETGHFYPWPTSQPLGNHSNRHLRDRGNNGTNKTAQQSFPARDRNVNDVVRLKSNVFPTALFDCLKIHHHFRLHRAAGRLSDDSYAVAL